jgi:hypothetical protein
MQKNMAPATLQPTSILEDMQRSDLNQWHAIVSRITHPVTARLVVQLLDNDPHLRQHRIGTYLAACETVELAHRRHAKARGAAKIVESIFKLPQRFIQKFAKAMSVAQAKTWGTGVKKSQPSVLINRSQNELVFPAIFDPFCDSFDCTFGIKNVS